MLFGYGFSFLFLVSFAPSLGSGLAPFGRSGCFTLCVLAGESRGCLAEKMAHNFSLFVCQFGNVCVGESIQECANTVQRAQNISMVRTLIDPLPGTCESLGERG